MGYIDVTVVSFDKYVLADLISMTLLARGRYASEIEEHTDRQRRYPAGTPSRNPEAGSVSVFSSPRLH